MKKIILLLLFILLISGCYDYVELNDLSIVTMIIIDKDDDKYNINFEILNDQKHGEKSSTNKSIIVKGSGKTITEAISDATLKTPKEAYFAHLTVLAISKDVAKNDLKQVIEYFLRSPHIRNEFYLTIVNNKDAKEILNVNKEENPIISDYISSMLKDDKKYFNNITDNNFENILIDIAEKGIDATIPVIKYEDNQIKSFGTALLDKYELKDILSSEEASLLNILKNNANNTIFTFQCLNSSNTISLSMYSGKTKIDIDNRNVLINIKLMGEIEEYNCNDNLKNTNTFKKYNKHYEEIINSKIIKLYSKLSSLNTDSLGIGKKLYIKRRYYDDSNWINLKPSFKTDLKINKEGLIFEVANGN